MTDSREASPPRAPSSIPVLDRLPWAVVVLRAGDLALVHVNRAACRERGWREPPPPGAPLATLDDAPGFAEVCREARARGAAVEAQVGARRLHAEPDGDTIVVAWTPAPAGIEAALGASEHRFRALADSMPQLVWTASGDGVVDYYNARAAEYAGLRVGPDGRWRWEPVVHPDDLAATVAAWDGAVAAGAAYACEHRLCMADGSYRWHVSRARPVATDGAPRWYGTATDIHELKLIQDQLGRTVASRDQVVSVVAHDLRNPLNVVRTSLPLLRTLVGGKRDVDPSGRVDACLARLDRQTTRMERLLDELLDVARLQAGQPLPLDLRPCDLVGLVREHVTELATPGSRHSIELRAGATELVGRWDAPRVERVLGNLLSNAIKYSPAGEPIVVEVARAGADALVRVIDRGVGIPDGDRARIFEWFARGANAERTARGSGIGLAGARHIVAQHGGAITVDSELGRGSTFTVRLPLEPPGP